MFRTFLIAFLLSAAFVINSSAQIENQPTARQILKSKVESGDYEAIAKAGNSNDLTLIPYLKRLASNIEQRNNSNSAAFQAHIASAKLGDAAALEEILLEVDAEDPDIQSKAMSKLAAIGNDAAFRKFYQLLDDTAPRANPRCISNVENFRKNHPEDANCSLCCDVVYFSRSTTAMLFLWQMVDNPPTRSAFATEKGIPLWKTWFEKNKPWIR